MKLQSTFGYTIIELVVAAAIIAVLVGGGMAAYARSNDRQRVRQAADELVTQLRVVQKKADAGESPTGCTGAFDGYQVKVESASTTSAQIYALCDAPVLIDSLELKNGATFADVDNFAFLPLGRGISPTAALSLQVNSPNATHYIDVAVGEGGTISSGVIMP